MDIDYVIAWVDGQDPKHIALRQQFSDDQQHTHAEAKSVERYQDNGEIYYHLASIIKYAPFIRRVLIVSDNQKPRYLDDFFAEGICDPSFIQLVSHDEIFDGLNALRPSFNARAIESTIWRLKGLSEHFIYANDDFFLNKPVAASSFFADGKPVLHGSWQTAENTKWKYRFKQFLEAVSPYRYQRPNHGLSQWKAAVLAGVKGSYFNVHHIPHPLRRSTIESFFRLHPALLEKQVRYRYRNIEQFNFVALVNNLEILNHGVETLPLEDFAYVDHVKPKNVMTALGKIVEGTTKFGCIQGFEQFDKDMRHHIHDVMVNKFRDVLPQAFIKTVQKEAV